MRATTLGDWLMEEENGDTFVNPSKTYVYPRVTMNVGEQECGLALRRSKGRGSGSRTRNRLPRPMNRKGLDPRMPVFIVGDLNSLSPSDEKFYQESHLVEHIRNLIGAFLAYVGRYIIDPRDL